MVPELSRRDLLRATASAGVGAAFAPRALALLGDDAKAATVCVLTPETTEGPYWIDGALTRRDVREGRAGLPLVVRFAVLDVTTCKPIRNADVELWHCDAAGVYSGVDGANTRFLRGHQRTDGNGKAEFLTVFPGWYPGRTPHIHMKVHVGGTDVHTGQVFFDEALTRRVYAKPPYARRGRYDTAHARDLVYAEAGGSSAELRLVRRGPAAKGYIGTIAVGVRR
ncbi:MAG: intradiol ring-cleavage dioxygenase [Gaiellales bacterium]